MDAIKSRKIIKRPQTLKVLNTIDNNRPVLSSNEWFTSRQVQQPNNTLNASLGRAWFTQKQSRRIVKKG
jgi:hypothetical protein